MSSVSLRLDDALAKLGYFADRQQAQRALLAGELELNGRRDMKAGWQVNIADGPTGPILSKSGKSLAINVRFKMPYVSRGAYKLVAALDAFNIDPKGMLALDVGSSTGGFTDCLLQRGATKVYAVDCGRGQLHETLRNDARVISMEKTNARFLTKKEIPETPDIIVADVSFISLSVLLPVMAALGKSGTTVITLVKPQFEAPAAAVMKGGVVRDPKIRLAMVDKIRSQMVELGWQIIDFVESPIVGPAGNHEFLLGALQ